MKAQAIWAAVTSIRPEAQSPGDGHAATTLHDAAPPLAGCSPGLLLAVVAAGSLGAAEPTPSALESEPSGWISIMPPADLNGWSRVGAARQPLGKQQWHMDESGKILVCEGDGGHDMLLCNREFGDAVFHVEFRYTKVEGKSGYNSGVYVRNSTDGAIWHQAQIGDAAGGYLFGETPGPDGQKRFFTTTEEVKEGRVKAAGEWNTLEITARGKTLTLWVNGAVTCQVALRPSEGPRGSRRRRPRIEFRNLKVKRLP